ncbi:ICP22 family protein [Halorientalis regularis]|uniref:Uncharacterized protein n=1 Tax=Halorientalis regularis TaxID=660518 RepID=A0A1G7GUJ4_9EURY|nr:hypothetical protein [Halorientalis regularis]SDE91764.1 hypothetical protein SAMN05216218_102190 [Halorientalis regularis]
MGLFDSVRGLVSGDDEPGDDADAAAPERRDPTPTTFRNKAADAVADWDAHELDYSLDSLSRLDDFADKQGAKLDVMHDEGDDDVADLHTRYTIQAGSYLGEVLVRQRGGEWVEDGERWAVSLEYEGEPATVDVFELAGHSFAEEPVFGEVADRFTEDDDEGAENPDPDPVDTSDMETLAEELADFWDEYDLNFSPRSLARLDELADSEWDDDRFADAELGASDMDSGMFTELVKQLGSYYGETLVRSLDAEWTRRDDDIVVAVEGNTSAPPVPVPVFSVAEDSLTGPSMFATRFNDLTDRATLEVPEVATTAGVTPATETPAATNREDEDLTAVQPDSADGEVADSDAADADETGADADPETPTTAATETADDPADPAQVAGADAQSVDGGVVSEGGGAKSGSADGDPAEGDETDSLAASVVGGADDTATGDSSDGGTEPESAETDADDDGRVDAETDEVTDATDSETADEAFATEPTVDPEGKSPVETAIAETVAAGLVDRGDGAGEGDETAATAGTNDPGDGTDAAEPTETVDAQPADGAGPDDEEPTAATPGAGASESDPDADAERAALAAEISDSGPAESGPTLPTPAELHDNAEAFAATYPGYDLDFSPDSLERLDRLVTEEYDPETFADFDLADPGSQFQLDRVTEAGGYFALVIEGTVGGEWERTDDGLQFVVEGANGVARLDPLGVAAGCFRDDDSFAATYAAIRDRLGA